MIYLAVLIAVLVMTKYFVKQMLFDQQTANIVLLVAIVLTVVLTCINYIVMNPMLKIIVELQLSSQKNAEGEFTTLKKKTIASEITHLVTDYNKMVDQLEKQLLQIKHSEKEKNEMVANLSHDIKTPASSLIALSQALEDDILEEDEKKYYLEAVVDNCHRIAELANELYDVVDHDDVSLEKRQEKIWLDALLIKVLTSFKGKIDHAQREVTIEGTDRICPIYSDESKLYRIFYNIIDNSLKYSQKGAAIKIMVNANDGYIRIAIKDEGQGIPLAEQQRIFHRTYRIEKSRNQATGGHGLGLSITKKLVENIGGTITVHSQIGEGSTFYVDIPYKKEKEL